jgi:hypothetical protein
MVTELTNGVVMLYFVAAIKVTSFLPSLSAVVNCENLCRFYSLGTLQVCQINYFIIKIICSLSILSLLTTAKFWDSDSEQVGREILPSVPGL